MREAFFIWLLFIFIVIKIPVNGQVEMVEKSLEPEDITLFYQTVATVFDEINKFFHKDY